MHEYDNEMVKQNKVAFKEKGTDLERYITFFNSLNGRPDIDSDEYGYERCALLMVDFNKETSRLYE
jgi:hypothetical protein